MMGASLTGPTHVTTNPLPEGSRPHTHGPGEYASKHLQVWSCAHAGG